MHFAFVFHNVNSSTSVLSLSQVYTLEGLRGPLDIQGVSLIYTSDPIIPEPLAFLKTALCSLKALSVIHP